VRILRLAGNAHVHYEHGRIGNGDQFGSFDAQIKNVSPDFFRVGVTGL
jgi:hypothetical protein